MKYFIKLFITFLILTQIKFTAISQDTIKPMANCFNGIAEIEIPMIKNYIALAANYFDHNSSDNISNSENLRFSFSEDINHQIKPFCHDGIEEVTIFVWDEANNYSTCSTKLKIGGWMHDLHEPCCECYGDYTDPTIICKNLNGEINDEGKYYLNIGNLVDTSFDNIKVDFYSKETYYFTTLTCNDLGEKDYTIIAYDGNNNYDTCTALLTLTDPNNYCATASKNRNDTEISISVQPNPATNEVTINNAQQFQSIHLINLNGTVISKFNSPGKNLKIDTSKLVDGIYFIQGINENKKTVNKRLTVLK